MPRFAFVVFISRPRESKREMSCVYAHPFRVFFVWFRAENLLIYFPKRTARSFAENSERKARDSSRLWCLSHDRERVKERYHAFMRTLFGCFLCGFVSKSPHYFPKRTVRSFAENSERKARDSKDEEADPSRERQTGIRGLFCALVLSLSQ